MPGFYQVGDYELAGFIVGVVEEDALLGPDRVEAGDLLIGLPSSGLHTNGYSLARHVLLEKLGLEVSSPLPWSQGGQTSGTVGEALLAVHRTYLPAIRPQLGNSDLHAMAHITGGGLTDNLPRILPSGLGAHVDRTSWIPDPLFDLLQRGGEVTSEEMFRVFNMGVGMVLVVSRDGAASILSELTAAGCSPWILGEVQRGYRVDYGA
jgi:phosphoribosylformylglycinamidine cyclo-ligase